MLASLPRRGFRKLYRLASPALDRLSAFMPETAITPPRTPYEPRENLIIDLGMNDGTDTFFYLKKNFNVVAAEANPIVAAKAENRLARFIASDRLRIINKGVTDRAEDGPLDFYINYQNSSWSSFIPYVGKRDETPFSIRKIPMIGVGDLFREFGTPYYLKIDIEGFDERVVKALSYLPFRPRFISVEESGAGIIDSLRSIGATGFKLVSQTNNPAVKLPFPAEEGRYCRHYFVAGSSGPFGNETPGEWQSYEDFRRFYVSSVRAEDGTWLGPANDWFDIHARF